MRYKISAAFSITAFALIPAVYATGQQGHTEELTAEGVVVAVQLDPGAARSAMDVNSESLGDFAEVWMVRVNRLVSPNGAKYVLVEYTHVNRHEPFVTNSELDSKAWKFTLRPVPEDRRGPCGGVSDMYLRHSADLRSSQAPKLLRVSK